MPKNFTFFFCLVACLIFSNLSFAQLFNKKETFSRADSLRGTLSPLRTAYEIEKYNIDIDIDPEQKRISGSNRFEIIAKENFNQIQIDLFDNLNIDSIKYQDQNLSFSREHNAVFIDFPETIFKGSEDSFIIYYSGNPIIAQQAPWDGGFVWREDNDGLPWIATACQGLGASSWWPTKDHQSAKAKEVILSATVPKGVMNVSNGRLIEETQLPNGKSKSTWKVTYPINNYNIALNIANYMHRRDNYEGESGILDIDYFVLIQNKDKLSHLKKNAKQTLEAFEYWFGPYPFYNDGYKLVETPHLGMEHQSAIAYGNQFQNGYLGKDRSDTGWGMKWDFIIVHESGHEWFGNNITAKDIADMWIHEAFTTYSESLFVDYFYGKEAGQEYIYGTRKNILNDKPIQGPYGVNTEGSGDMYIKGSVMLNQLRTLLEDDQNWRNLLRNLNKDFRYSTVDYEDIVQYIIDYTGLNLRPFFEQYIKTAEIPTLEIRKDQNGSLKGRWKSSIKNFAMPIHLGKNEDTLKLVWLTDSFQEIKIAGLNKTNLKIDEKNYYIQVDIS